MAGKYGQWSCTHLLFINVLVFFWRCCNGGTLCDASKSESLSMCSSGQVRGTFVVINTQSYKEAVMCRCTLTSEVSGFVTAATASVPNTGDCKSHVVLDIQTKRLIQCTKNPTYFIPVSENESGNITFSTAYDSHGNTKYSLQFCGAKLFVVCYAGERTGPTNETNIDISTTQKPLTTTERDALTKATTISTEQQTPTATEKKTVNVGGIVGGVLVPVLLIAMIAVFIFRKRQRKFSDSILRTPLPSIDKLVHESTKRKGGEPIPSEANVEAVYATIDDSDVDDSIQAYHVLRRNGSLRYSKSPTALNHKPQKEDNDGYLQCYDAVRRSSDLQYSNSSTAHALTQEENENVTNGYLDVVK